jgi:hypothetical protein
MRAALPHPIPAIRLQATDDLLTINVYLYTLLKIMANIISIFKAEDGMRFAFKPYNYK